MADDESKKVEDASLESKLPTRVEALYDCDGDEEDELTFVTGEIIAVTGTNSRLLFTCIHFCFQAKKTRIGGKDTSSRNRTEKAFSRPFL